MKLQCQLMNFYKNISLAYISFTGGVHYDISKISKKKQIAQSNDAFQVLRKTR
jgi:hypothetical protein